MSDSMDFMVQEAFRNRFDMMQKQINTLERRIRKIETSLEILLEGLTKVKREFYR